MEMFYGLAIIAETIQRSAPLLGESLSIVCATKDVILNATNIITITEYI